MSAATTHPARLAEAEQDLATALASTKPLDDALRARITEAVGAERMAQCDAEVAAIAATIPALTELVEELRAKSCYRCSGTGLYRAPTSYLSRGKPLCFTCHGTGLNTPASAR